jgi:cytochrome c553
MAWVVKITPGRVLAAVASLMAAGLLIAWSGVINIAASTGHWMITDRFLHWSMRNAVRTRSALTIEDASPDPSELVSAAGHYAVSSVHCHGAPGVKPSPVMVSSTPTAPDLAHTANEWTDRQLQWIVKHGIKFTPMPAWPAQERDDEVGRMAAFVRRLPEMSPGQYEALASGPGKIGGASLRNRDEALQDCERCHAENGRDQPDIPVLAGQKPHYLLAALTGYARGTRQGAVMRTAASRIDARTMRELAEHYGALPNGLTDSRTVPLSGKPGDVFAARIVQHGLPEADLPPCSKCHSPGKHARYPVLVGQKEEYLAARLRRWRGKPEMVEARQPDESMPTIARRIPEHMIDALARHFARQGAATSMEEAP